MVLKFIYMQNHTHQKKNVRLNSIRFQLDSGKSSRLVAIKITFHVYLWTWHCQLCGNMRKLKIIPLAFVRVMKYVCALRLECHTVYFIYFIFIYFFFFLLLARLWFSYFLWIVSFSCFSFWSYKTFDAELPFRFQFHSEKCWFYFVAPFRSILVCVFILASFHSIAIESFWWNFTWFCFINILFAYVCTLQQCTCVSGGAAAYFLW